MLFNHVRLFSIVANHRSITKAAAMLHVTHSSISHQLGILQNDIGVDLYKTTGHGIELTNDGHMFAVRCKTILRGFDNLKSGLGNGGDKRARRALAAGAGYGRTESILSVVLARYRERNPLTTARLCTGESVAIERFLQAGKIDLGLVVRRPSSRRIAAELFSEEDIVPFVSARRPLVKRSSLSLEEFTRVPLIVREGASRGLNIDTSLRKINGRRGPHIVLRCDSSEAVKSAVEHGQGVGLLSRSHITGDNARKFRIVSVPGLNLRLSRFIIYRKDRPLSPAAHAFLNMLRAEAPPRRSLPRRRRPPRLSMS